MTKEERIHLFTTELNSIKNKSIKEFAIELLINADDYFFVVPASSSGKYHPAYAAGNMGLIRHTKAVVYFLTEMLRSELFGFTSDQNDCLIVAAMAHDIKKQGDGTGHHTVGEHPKLAAEYVRRINIKSNLISVEYVDFICSAIETHMGQWGKRNGLRKPETPSEKLVHLADLIASRKTVNIDFTQLFPELNLNHDTITESVDAPINTEPGDFVCTFGKHKGKPIKEIPVEYLNWAIHANINQTEFIEAAKKYCNK